MMDRIKTAGGIVFKDEKFLFIYKRGMWDLPKGKFKNGDSEEETALIEVHEETGLPLEEIKIVERLIPTYYIKTIDGKHLQKKTWWFLMQFTGDPLTELVPALEEDIEECRWVSEDELEYILPATHERIVYLFDYLKQLPVYRQLMDRQTVPA